MRVLSLHYTSKKEMPLYGFIFGATFQFRMPDELNPVVHARRASAHAERGEIDAAINEATRALQLEPQFSFAHLLLAKLLSERALAHLAEVQKPFDSIVTPYTGSGRPVRVLQLGSARTVGLTNTDAILDSSLFESTTIIVQYWDPQRALPPHDVVVNAIADPDSSGGALDVAGWVAGASRAPIVNRPDCVRATGRLSNAQRLANLPGVVAPAMVAVPRDILMGTEAERALAERSFQFPLLLRSPGYHNGEHFVFVNDPDELPAATQSLPGQELFVMQFTDTRGSDGRFRKYRVMVVDGKLYPAHLAVSHHWNVHYFSAQMGVAERAEEARFLETMESSLDRRRVEALGRIAETLALDYTGIDFSISPNGDVVVFEANAAMTIFLPEASPDTNYRRQAALRIFEAAKRMILERAASR